MMDFGDAIRAMKQGCHVSRKGWNGKGMFLYLEAWGDAKDEAGYEPCIVIRNAVGELQPGWLASQADMLATDWEVTT